VRMRYDDFDVPYYNLSYVSYLLSMDGSIYDNCYAIDFIPYISFLLMQGINMYVHILLFNNLGYES